jgi:hypothetical protein
MAFGGSRCRMHSPKACASSDCAGFFHGLNVFSNAARQMPTNLQHPENSQATARAVNLPMEIGLRPGKRCDQKTGNRLNILDLGKSNAGKMQ